MTGHNEGLTRVVLRYKSQSQERARTQPFYDPLWFACAEY